MVYIFQSIMIVFSKSIIHYVVIRIVPEDDLFMEYFMIKLCEIIPELTILTYLVCL